MRPCFSLRQGASSSNLSSQCAVANALPMRPVGRFGAPKCELEVCMSFACCLCSDGHQIREVRGQFWPVSLSDTSRQLILALLLLQSPQLIALQPHAVCIPQPGASPG